MELATYHIPFSNRMEHLEEGCAINRITTQWTHQTKTWPLGTTNSPNLAEYNIPYHIQHKYPFHLSTKF